MESISKINKDQNLVNALFDSSLTALAYFNCTFEIERTSSLFRKLLSLEGEPKKLSDLGLFTEKEWKDLSKRLEEEKSFSLVEVYQKEELEKTPLALKLIGVFDDDEYKGGLLFLENQKIPETEAVTLSKEASFLLEKESLISNLYEESPLGILMISDAEAKIMHANPMICKMLGYEEVELKKLTAYDITHPEDRNKHKPKFEESISTEYAAFDFEKRYVRKDGSIIWVNIAASIVRNEAGQPMYNLATIQDITEKHLAKELIKKQLETLNLQNQKLEKYIESNLQLENFAYIASHDLKAPLRSIGNFTQLLKRKSEALLETEDLEFIDYIIEGVKDMNAIIDSLLIYSKVSSSSNSVVKVDVPHILNNVLRNLDASIQESNAKITIEKVPPFIIANKTKMTQLFQNLIANGLKFQKAGQTPEIKVSGKEVDEYWEFKIEDNGIGIEQQYHDQIFTLFKRLHGKKDYDGSGIGLAYCKRVVDKHGGDIWLESEVGKGTTFFFRFLRNATL